MKVIIHAGAFATDDGRITKCLRQNKRLAEDWKVGIPEPRTYQKRLSVLLGKPENYADPNSLGSTLRSVIVDEDYSLPNRVVLSHKNFFGLPKFAIANGEIFPEAVPRFEAFKKHLAPHEVELFFSVRNIATWLPEVFSATSHHDLPGYLCGVDPSHLHWSRLADRLSTSFPNTPITIWCNEDSPLIWGEIVRSILGVPEGTKIKGAFDMLATIIKPEGMRRLRSYLGRQKGLNDIQKRRIMAAFFDKYAIEDAVMEELDIPGWTSEYVDYLGSTYERDIDRIEVTSGVRLLTPW